MRIEDATFDRTAVLPGLDGDSECDRHVHSEALDNGRDDDACTFECDLSPARRLEISWLLGAEFAAEWRLAALYGEIAELERTLHELSGTEREEEGGNDVPLYAMATEEATGAPPPRVLHQREIIFVYQSLTPSGRLVDLLM